MTTLGPRIPIEVEEKFDVKLPVDSLHGMEATRKRFRIYGLVELSWEGEDGKCYNEERFDVYEIDRLVDEEAGVVLYVLREDGGRKGGGIACLPLIRTTIGEEYNDEHYTLERMKQEQKHRSAQLPPPPSFERNDE